MNRGQKRCSGEGMGVARKDVHHSFQICDIDEDFPPSVLGVLQACPSDVSQGFRTPFECNGNHEPQRYGWEARQRTRAR